MKDSESKALNWSENIYHKFEAIIPDVHDIKIQGSFKYMENHVNTVGGSFKKFCSGVVQDFFPPSMDVVEHDTEAAMTPKRSRALSVDSEESKIEAVTSGFSNEASLDSVSENQSCGMADSDANVDELKLAKSMDSRENLNDLFNELADESSDTIDVDGIKKCQDGLCDLTSHDIVTESVVSTTMEPEAFYNLPFCDTGSDFGALRTGSCRRIFSDTVVSLSPNVTDITGRVSDSHKEPSIPTPISAMLLTDRDTEKQLVSSSSSNLLLISKDDFSLDVAADLGMETINLHDEVKLGDSCVFVDDTELYAVSRRARKLGSYRKKIQELFTSKKRLAKEYEQLAIWYGDADLDSSPIQQTSQTRQVCDSEWELL